MAVKIHTKDTSSAAASTRRAAAADVQAKLQVGTPGDRFENEADQVAEKVLQVNRAGQRPAMSNGKENNAVARQISRVDAGFGKAREEKKQLQAEEEVAQARHLPGEGQHIITKEAKKEPVTTKKAQRKEAAAQTKPQRQEETSEEAAQTNLQRQEEAGEEAAQTKLQRQEEAGEEAAQTKLQRQEETSEEAAQTKLQRQEETSEEQAQAKPLPPGGKLAEKTAGQERQPEISQAKSGPRAIFRGKKDNPFATQIESKLQATRGGGEPLPEALRAEMESHFGVDFQKVRIHTGADARQMAADLNAQAFTSGGDIYFNAGKYDPESIEGKRLLAHELTHTVQQDAAQVKEAKNSPATNQPESAPAEKPARPAQIVAPALAIPAETPGSQPLAPAAAPTPIPTKAAPTSEKEKAAPAEPAPQALSPAAAPVAEGERARPRSPEEDPNFQALQERAKDTAQDQKAHRPSTALAQNAGDAAPSPPNEVTSEAQVEQVNEMNQQEPGLFDAATFKGMLLEQIKKILPKNEDEADDFAEKNQMDDVKEAASQKVEEEKTDAGGGIKEASYKEPDTASITPRDTVPLEPPKPGAKPPSLEAGNAMPPARPESEVSHPLQENAQEVDDEMAANNVTDEQLDKSEEPSFISALESKNTAQEHSKSAPEGFRQQEKGVLESSKKESEVAGEQQVAGMYGARKGLFNAVSGIQVQTSKGNTSERDRVAAEIDGIYEKAKTDVETQLDQLDTYVETEFDRANETAKKTFEDYVEIKMDAYKEKRYGSWYNPVGLARRAGDVFTGLPDEVNKFFEEGRDVYINQMDVALTAIAQHIAKELKAAKDRIAKGKADVQKYVDALPANLKQYGKEKQEEMQDKFAALEDSVVSKQEELIDTIATKYKESLGEVDARIKEMKEANRGLIDKAIGAIKGVIETIKKLKQLIQSLLSAIASVIEVIIADPIGFMKDLFGGIGQGIDNFKSRIKEHLIGGLFKWLTGALGPMGITIPENLFSLSGIFNLIMQVLGLGWDFIRQKAVKMLGEPAVAALEKGFELFQIFREKGIAGIWEYLKEQFQDLKETVLEAIQNMIITQVIEAGIKWLLSLLIPGAGFIKAIMAIKDLIVFFVESAIALIPALIDAVKAAAARNMSMIAKAIENGLALLLPLVINLLAKLIGISGLAAKVQKIIKNIRKRIDRQVNKLLAKAKKWVKKIFRKAKAKVKKAVGKLIQWWKAKKKFKGEDGKTHKLFFKGNTANADLMIASEPTPLERFLTVIKKAIKDMPSGRKKSGAEKSLLNAHALDQEIKQLEKKLAKANTGEAQKKGVQANQKLFTDLKGKLDDLGNTMGMLMNVSGHEGNPPPPLLPPFSNNVQGQSFKAQYLSAENNVPRGEESTKSKGNLGAWAELIDEGTRERDNFVRMHLLHHKMGGKATDSNLTPAKSVVNTDFYNQLELPALKDSGLLTGKKRKKGKGKEPHVIWYAVQVAYHSGDEFAKNFIKSIKAEYGYHDPANNWKEGPVQKEWTASPGVPEHGKRNKKFVINEDGKTALKKMRYSKKAFSSSFIDLLVLERNTPLKGGGRKNYISTKNIENRLQTKIKVEKSASEMKKETQLLIQAIQDQKSNILLNGKD